LIFDIFNIFNETSKIGTLSINDPKEIRTELDSHADTSVVGKDTALMIHDFGRAVNVYGYNDTIGQARCKTISAVVAYDHPKTGDTYMLVTHRPSELNSGDGRRLSELGPGDSKRKRPSELNSGDGRRLSELGPGDSKRVRDCQTLSQSERSERGR
jgi:hypothetical protein